MRISKVVLWTASLLLVGVGLALLATYFLSQNPTSAVSSGSGDFNVPGIPTTQRQSEVAGAEAPGDTTLELTVPKMSRIENDAVPNTAGDDEQALKENAAIHLKGTGFPWQREANVYLAGHRLGYPATGSFLAFYDLNKLEKGDKAYLTDADGTTYTYEVYKKFIVEPTDLWVIEPVEGRNILTLQTCTLPDYAKRLIVRAGLVEVART